MRDLLKLAVVERHSGTGNVGVAFARGFGLKRGAIASSVAHDSHNVVVVGADDASMETAVRRVAAIGGGVVVADGAQSLAEVPLPVAGLMSNAPMADVDAEERRAWVDEALARLPEHQRVPLVLYHYEDVPYDEIARRLGVSLAKVKTDILRARAALAKILSRSRDPFTALSN